MNKKKNFVVSDGAVICLAPKELALARNAKAYPLINFMNKL